MRERPNQKDTPDITVCHVSTMTNWGGVERLLEDSLIHSHPTGIRNLLLATSWSPDVVSMIQAANIPTLLLQRNGRFDLRAIHHAVSWLRNERVDVLHSYNAFANIWGSLLATLARIPIFITGEHGTIWRTSGALFQLDRLAQRTAMANIVNSQAAAMLLHHRYGAPFDKIHVVTNAVAPLPAADVVNLRRSLGLGDAPVVGSIGRLDSPKDYHTLIDAAALVLRKNENLRFMLVGGGPLEAELRARVTHLGIGGHFLMTGFRPDARQLVQAFDLFVGTSIRESFGNVFVEAALAGVPAIAPMIDGIPEVVIDGQTGVLLAPRLPVRLPETPATPIGSLAVINGRLAAPQSLDPAELAGAILNLMADPEQRASLGAEAYRQAKLRFSLERYTMDLVGLYRHLAAKPSSN